MTDIALLKENAAAYDYSQKDIAYEEFMERYKSTDEKLEYRWKSISFGHTCSFSPIGSNGYKQHSLQLF